MTDLAEQILSYAESGELSYREIARRLGCTQPYVSKIMKDIGRVKRVDWSQIDDYIRDEIEKGVSKRVIAEELGIKYPTLYAHTIVKGWGVKEVKHNERLFELGGKIVDKRTGKVYYDYTDLLIDRSPACETPQWKKELETYGKILTVEEREDEEY